VETCERGYSFVPSLARRKQAVDISGHMQISSMQYPDAAFMALRLLLLRATEQLSDDLRKSSATISAPALSEVVQVVRMCSQSRLHFASQILKVGRQLEPSCFNELFPLPTEPEKSRKISVSSFGVVAKPARWVSLRNVFDFVSACLDDGSLLLSVSSLPIIPGDDLSMELCHELLDHCLRSYDDNTTSETDFFFDVSLEERTMLKDIFRFGAKLEDSPHADFGVDSQSNNQPDHPADEDSVDSSDVDDESPRKQRYSLACGMLNISWFSNGGSAAVSTAKAKQKLTNGGQKRSESVRGELRPDWRSSHQPGKSFASSVALFLLEMAMPNDRPTVRSYRWRRSAVLSILLLGHGNLTLPTLSADECTSLAKSAMSGKIVGGQMESSGATAEDRVAALLTRCIEACSSEIGSEAAGKILDLVLNLLRVSRHSSDFDATLPGLFVIGITAGHVCNRVRDILDIDNKSISFARSYFAAREKMIV
jgi:hypothetical protein